MASKKKKVKKSRLGSAARYGARYSSTLKQKVNAIEKVQKRAQPCPQCGRKSLYRKGYARWKCSKCGAEMAGGAYSPRTALGTATDKIVSGKLSQEEARAISAEVSKDEEVEE